MNDDTLDTTAFTTADLNAAEQLARDDERAFLDIDDDSEGFEPTQVPDHEGYKALRAAVLERVKAYLIPAGSPADMIEPYAELLSEDIEKELYKFACGQREHGGDIRDRDLDAELEPELIDARIYVRCKKLQASYVKVTI
jgi:hypothetical protein